MPDLRTYRLFISHAWDYNDEYNRLINMLNSAPLFRYANYSVPEHDPLPNRQLKQGFYNQIRPVNVVVILSGMYVTYSDSIQIEIDIALELEKPIIGIMPWGSNRMPHAVQEAADDVVGWNTVSIVDAIRRHSI